MAMKLKRKQVVMPPDESQIMICHQSGVVQFNPVTEAFPSTLSLRGQVFKELGMYHVHMYESRNGWFELSVSIAGELKRNENASNLAKLMFGVPDIYGHAIIRKISKEEYDSNH